MRAANILVAFALILGSSACATGSTNRIRMGELNSVLSHLGGLEGDPLEKEPVEYRQVGKPDYDRFFKESSTVRANVVVSNALAESMSKNVKNYARSYAAANATDDAVKEIVGDTKPENLTDEQSIALLQLQKKRNQLGADQAKYAASAGVNGVQTGAYLLSTKDNTQKLIGDGKSLLGKVPTDFQGMEAMKAPGATSGLNDSVDHLSKASTQIPDLAQKLTRLGMGLQSLL